MTIPISKFLEFAPPGHFYSPIPDPSEIDRRRAELFSTSPESLPGIDLRVENQLALLERIAHLSEEFPYGATKNIGRSKQSYRYTQDNQFFIEPDAFTLYSFIRFFQPKRIVEIGSGYSSALILDTVEEFLDYSPDLIFVDPHPDRLKKLLRSEDAGSVGIREMAAQSLPITEFAHLSASDILFIDSSHVGKCGSDVLHLLFNVLPRLAPGVLIHLHDMFWPFEYPESWYLEGRCWNEAYLIRAMLTFSSAFEIVLWPSFLEAFCPTELRKIAHYARSSGGSLWLRRAAA
jgi:predicted O-methyltransferase YrrM